MFEHVTKQDKFEFIRRCKELARRDGERVQYCPARWVHEPCDDLNIQWCADECSLHVRVRLPNRRPFNEAWSMVVEQGRGQPTWGYIHQIPHHLVLMRQMMILDDLADV